MFITPNETIPFHTKGKQISTNEQCNVSAIFWHTLFSNYNYKIGMVAPFSAHCISDQKVTTVVVRNVQKCVFLTKNCGRKFLGQKCNKNCVSDQNQ